MAKIKNLFNIENAKSKGYEHYEEGNIPFVTNGDYDNSIVGFVKPLEKDRVFEKASICLSSFCEATIQTPPFLPRGNGGSGLVVLVPKKEMTEEELYFYTAQINMMKWKFSFSRMLIGRRIQNLEIVTYKDMKIKIKEKLNELIPKEKSKQKIQENQNIKIMRVKDLCEIKKKTAIPQNAMNLNGKIPYVTTSSMNNGVSQFADEEPNFEGKCLSVAMNGSVGEVFFQINDFITSGDNAVLNLKSGYNPFLLFFIGTLIRNHKWRYNYYRKMSLDKLKNLELPIPMKRELLILNILRRLLKTLMDLKK